MMIKFDLKITKFLPLFMLILVLAACQDDDDNGNVIEGTNSIINYIDKNERFSLFQEIIITADMELVLDGNAGVLTLLAPNNEAVQTYYDENGIASAAELTQEEAFNLVNYHLIETITPEDNFVTGYLKTLSEVAVTDSTSTTLSMLVETNNDDITLNGDTSFIDTDIEVDNGIMHEINQVLERPTLKTFLEADENFNSYYQEVLANHPNFNSEVIESEDNHSIFVPTSDALTDYFQNNSLSQTEVEQLLYYHSKDSLVNSGDLPAGFSPTKATIALNGEEENLSLYTNKDLGLLLNGNATIVLQDLVTTNGVIHMLDEVLEIPTLTDFILANNNLDSFEASLDRDDIASEDFLNRLDTQSNGSPFTVFAPTTDAFDDGLIELFPNQNATLEDIPAQDLINILNTHLAENINIDLENTLATTINTIQGTLQISVNEEENLVLVDENGREALVFFPAGQATNGKIYLIDTLLLPLQN